MLSIPDHVHVTAGPDGGSVLLDQRSGRCYAMNGTAHELWREWSRTGDFDAGVALVAQRKRVGDTFAADCRRLADSLVAKELLVAGPPTTRRVEVAERPPVDEALPRFRFVALAAFPITVLLVLLPFRLTTRVLSWSRRRWCRLGTTTNQASAALTATGRAARLHPGRVACLEMALGAVVTLALTRRHLTLVIGVADDPCRFHAWVRAQDGPVSHSDDAENLADFRPIFSV